MLYRLIFGTIRYRHDIWPPSRISKLPYTRFWQCNPVNLQPSLASTQQTFAKDVRSLLASCEDVGNPFIEDSGDMLTLGTKVVMNKDAIRTVNAVEEIGQRQFSECVEDRLNIASNKPLSDIVSKNKLALFSTPQTKQRSRSKEQVASLKTNYTLVSTLFAKLGKATSTVSLNMKIRRAPVSILGFENCQSFFPYNCPCTYGVPQCAGHRNARRAPV